MRILFSFLILSSWLYANIATVVDTFGSATLLRDGKTLNVAPKLQLLEHDVIKTGAEAKVKIFFKDNTAVSLGKNTTFEIDKYLFTGDKKSEIKFKVLKGFFKTVTGKIGKIAPNKFKLQTKNATIGIRGTVFAAKVSDETDVVMCTDGSIVLFTPNGTIGVDAGSQGRIGKSSNVEVKNYTLKEKLALIKNAGWYGTMSLEELKEFIKNNFKEPLRSQLLEAIENIYEKDSSENKPSSQKITNADDISFIDDITINGREFDELPKSIEFYQEDLQEGKVVVEGLLESEDKNVDVKNLHVEITTDGGDTWSRAKGNDEWNWSFIPEFEKEYAFSLRVVKEEYIVSEDSIPPGSYDTTPTNPTDETVLPDTITIAGFTLHLDEGYSFVNGKLSGSGKIEIPYLSNITNLQNKIGVTLSNLSVENNVVTQGDIRYNNPFSITTPLADININSIVFSPIAQNNQLTGEVVFKDILASSFGTLALPQGTKLSPESFSLDIPFSSKILNIWQEKDVLLQINEGSLALSYSEGQASIQATLNIPDAQFKLGQLLRYANGQGAQVGMGNFGTNPVVQLPQDVFLLDTGIQIPSGLQLSYDLQDYTNPSITFSSSVNLENYTNDFAKNLQNATLSATVTKTGMSLIIQGDGGLDTITLIERGAENKNVRLAFEGNSPSLNLQISNLDEENSFSLSGVTPKVYFGDLFTDVSGQALNKVVSLRDIQAPSLNINQELYLLGSKIKLPQGFSANVNLDDLKAPILEFSVGIDFSEYDNIVAKQIPSATFSGTLSKEGLQASVATQKPSPIMVYEPNDVKIVFQGDSGPSFNLNITGNEALPSLDISDIQAQLDFGTLLKNINNEAEHVIAQIGVVTQDAVQALELNFPAKVKLLNSNFAFEGILGTLNLQDKSIALSSAVDLSGYSDNPLLKSLSGSLFDVAITPSSFTGTIHVEDSIDPINIWPSKQVVMTIDGKPSIGVSINSGDISFDFGSLNASIDFGALLKTAKDGVQSVQARFAQTVNDAGNYTLSLRDKAYLLGSSFALSNTQVSFNPSQKSLTLSSSVDLSSYTQPMVQAFDGATLEATVSTSGFSGVLSKEGEFKPIVIYDRGGVGKDVAMTFTSSPNINISILNSGIDFGFDGGSAQVDFGDLLDGAKAELNALSEGLYTWQLSGRHKLFQGAQGYIQDIKNAKLDISDFANPKVSFDADIDLSGYGGVLQNVTRASLRDVSLSKDGFSASLSASLGNIEIWKEKRVSLNFQEDPTINISINNKGFGLGLSNITAELDFGELMNARAQIGSIAQDNVASFRRYVIGKKDKTAKKVEQSIDSLAQSAGNSWSILKNNIALLGSDILLSNISGSVDFSDFSNPSITLNALADLRRYSSVFKYVSSAELQDVTISKEGLSGEIATTLEEISIWKEKNVKVSFNTAPSFYLQARSDGVKVGAKNIDANLHFGSLLNNAQATLRTFRDDVYSWQVIGKNKLASTTAFLSNLVGSMDFSDLENPIVNIASATLEGVHPSFRSLNIENAFISKDGFEAYANAQIDDINIYTEGTKKVDLNFKENTTPTLHVKLTRSEMSIGLSELQANLDFTNMLNNSSIKLLAGEEDGLYYWALEGTHNFLDDANGILSVSNIGGVIDLRDFSAPMTSFHTVADFSGYNFLEGVNLGIVDVLNAEIFKDHINWNVSIENARANFPILELGEGPNDDVRVELRNISGEAGNGGASLDGADGTLYFGKLFEGNKQVGLSLRTSDAGLKTYAFSLDENLLYSKDENNFITLQGISGQVIEIAPDTYKVVFNGSAEVRSSILSAINVGSMNISSLEISSSGFVGDFSTTFEDFSIALLNNRANINLTAIGLHVDSSLDIPISLNNFDATLDLSSFFDEEDVQATLQFIAENANVQWSLPDGTNLHVNSVFEFSNLSGSLDFESLDSLSLGLSGVFKYVGIEQSISFNDFTISSSGIEGTLEWNGSKEIFSGLDLNEVAITFAGIDTSGSFGLEYNNASFLSTGEALNLGLSGVVNSSGLDGFSVDGDLAQIDISNFAIFNFTGLDVSPDLNDFWLSLDGNVQPQNTLFSSDSELEFSNLRISSSGISLGGGSISTNISGASADLGALELSVTRIGLGFDDAKNLFYISANGGLSLDIIGDAEAGITLYSDKSINVNDIHIDINQNGLRTSGDIVWYDNDEIYGDGFKANLALNIAEIFSAQGLFRIGKINSTFYWAANASGGVGGGVAFGPLTMYEVGGGIAHNMIYNQEEKDFVPSNGTLSLSLSTVLGTSGDGGYLWNGNIVVTAAIEDGGVGQLDLDGESWILAQRGENPPERRVSAHMTYAPSMFHLWVNATINYKGITAGGSIDAIMSPRENHVFVGTDSEYAYAFNVDRDLGHVSVSIFGINGSGFFMVDERAIAFGQGIKIDKRWKKSWWGPDPSLSFKLEAGAKALFIYVPFQMLMDIYAEVALRGCYGGCISVGADVNVKVAAGHAHNYIWGKAGIKIFGKRISFSGYIHGSGELQDQPEEPEIEIFEKVEVSKEDEKISLIPYFKILSKFPKAQDAISVRLENVRLLKTATAENISLRNYLLDEDIQGKAYMPVNILERNRRYRLTGTLIASYMKDGEEEVKRHDFNEIYRTTVQDRIAFTDLITSITPANGDTDVHEDKGVEIKYNARALQLLGGVDSQYIRDYSIELYDADDNRIYGTFTPPDRQLVAKFKPNRDLRIYRYCVNEEGKIRETFVLDGVYLNPFNDFTQDDGDERGIANIVNQGELAGAQQGINMAGANLNPINQRDMQAALMAAQARSEGNEDAANRQLASLNNPRIEQISRAIPPQLRFGDIVLRNQQEALGELVSTSFARGQSYSYYRASVYKIKVRHVPTNTVVYNSSFSVRYNNIPAESRRKVEQMQGVLEPKFVVSLDEDRLGAEGIHVIQSSSIVGQGQGYNNGFYNEVRTQIDDGLMDIGVYAGVRTHVIARWELEKEDGSIEAVEQSVEDNGMRYIREFLPGIVRGYSAKIRYTSEVDGSLILEMPMILVTGDAFSAAAEKEEALLRREEMEEAAEEIRDQNEDQVEAPGGVGGVRDGFDGGFSHVGGGSNPMEQIGALGDRATVIGNGAINYGAAAAQGAGTKVIINVGR